MADYYAEFAAGGFGLIVSEGTYSDAAHSQAYPTSRRSSPTSRWSRRRSSTPCTRPAGGSSCQLMHAGALVQNPQARPASRPSAVHPLGRMLRGYGGAGRSRCRARRPPRIDAFVAAFAAGAATPRAAGFDGVEVTPPTATCSTSS